MLEPEIYVSQAQACQFNSLGALPAEVYCEAGFAMQLPFKGNQGGPKEGGSNIGQPEGLNSKELRVKHDRTSCYIRPPFLGTPLVPSRSLAGRPALALHRGAAEDLGEQGAHSLF